MALIALAVTVAAGVGLGVWMVTMAAGSAVSVAGEHGHEDSGTAAHDHEDAGVVAMPGLAVPAQPTADAMAGMSAVDMAAMSQPSPAQPTADEMAGMSAADMAAMSHDEAAPDQSGRPLGLTLAGFALLNVSVLLAALVIGRRRRAHRASTGDGPKRPQRSARSDEGAPRGRATSTSTQPSEQSGNLS